MAVLKATLVTFYLALSLLALDFGAAWSIDGLLGLGLWFLWVLAAVLALPIAWVSVLLFRKVLAAEWPGSAPLSPDSHP
jgi:hypothetical protein